MEITTYNPEEHKILADNFIYKLPDLSPDDEDVKHLLEVIKRRKIPITKERKNTGIGRSQPFGIAYKKWQGHKYDWCINNAKYPELYEAILKVGRKISPVGFSAIQVNHNYPAAPHYDINNVGHSVIFAIGEYEGGEFCLKHNEYDIANCENDIKLDICYKPILINAVTNMHYVNEITSGDRYSFVFFVGKPIGNKKPTDVGIVHEVKENV
jgi:hypothetical protein